MHSVISVLVAFAMVLFMGLSTLGISAGAVTQSDIDALAKKKKELQSQQASLQQTINNLRSQQADAYAQKEQLDREVEVIYQKIQVTQQEIQLYQAKIEEETAELQKQEMLRQEQEQKLKVRMRAMEENGRYGYLEVLMTAESLSDLLSKLDDVEQIMTNDKDLEDGYKAAVEQCSKIKGELETQEKELKNFESELKSQQTEMQKQIETAAATIASIQGDIDEYLTEYDLNAANLQEVTDDISSLEAQRAAAARAAAAAKAAASGTGHVSQSYAAAPSGAAGMFIWPTTVRTITSPYGYRYHPISGTYKFHSGVDIDGYQSMGSPIVAADGGTVIMAEYSGAYGNCIIFDHGNGMSTLYAHLSSMSVGVGSSVGQGQTIGGVGNTGNCYGLDGVHLHFEVRVNGNTTDPMGYIGGYPHSYY